jgi:hypothetical protein
MGFGEQLRKHVPVSSCVPFETLSWHLPEHPNDNHEVRCVITGSWTKAFITNIQVENSCFILFGIEMVELDSGT